MFTRATVYEPAGHDDRSWLWVLGNVVCLFAMMFFLSPFRAVAAPVAYWNMDGATVGERLSESLGTTSLNASESGGTSSWSTRSGFGNVLANGVATPYLTVPRSGVIDPGMGSFSLSIWLYRTSDASAPKGIVDALSGSAVSGYQLFYQSDNSIRLRIDDIAGNTVNVDTSSGHYVPNTWQNVIVTVDRVHQAARIYVNGVEATPAGGRDISAITGSIELDQDLWIGTFNGGTAARGRIDDFGIFDHVLTASQITAINAQGGVPLAQVDFSPVADVTITPGSGVLRPGDLITMATSQATDAIYYTLDGSDPDNTSTLYAAPITLPAAGEVRAVAYKNGMRGAVVSVHYVLIPEDPPNVVLIVADDIGIGDLSCYGAPTIHTPNLDQLARGGTRFTQLTTCGPGDVSNQYALLTGRVARRGGVAGVVNPGDVHGMDAREWTLEEVLRKAGYNTAFFGTWHLGDVSGSIPNDQGFQLFYGLPHHLGTVPGPPLMENDQVLELVYNPQNLLGQLTDRAKTFINSQSGTAPFFLLFQPPALPASGTSLQGDYGNRVEALDDAIGQLIATLESSGKLSNTLILFFSDGGPDLTATSAPVGSASLFRDGKSTTWEGGVRVPAIASWPGVIPAAVDNRALFWLPDFFFSLAEIANAYVPDDRPYDGKARPEVLLASRVTPDLDTTAWLYRYDGSGYQLQAYRKGVWKYHVHYQNADPLNTFSGSAPLLFHLENDPTEHINRSTSLTSILSELQQDVVNHEATFATAVLQLPESKEPFIGVPDVSIDSEVTVFTSSFVRPRDSLNDHYQIEYSTNLQHWTSLPIHSYITSITNASDDTEVVQLSVALDSLGIQSARYFIRLSATRP